MEKVKNHPGIYKRGGRYVATWRDPQGSLRKKSARTIAEAEDIRASHRTDVRRGEYNAQSNVTVADYARSWIASYGGRTSRGINADTLRDYRKALGLDESGELLKDVDGKPRGFLAFAGRLRMTEVTPPDIKSYAATLKKRGLSQNTVRLALAPVKAMFATAVEDHVIRWNPATGRLNVGPVDENEDGAEEEAKALTRDQLDALFDQLPKEWLPFFEFLAEYGLRISEAIELRGKDVELTDTGGVLHVRRRYYLGRVVGKPKAGSTRHLRLEPSRARALAAMTDDPEALLFTSDQGLRIDSSNLMARVLKPAAVRAGIGQWIEVGKGKNKRKRASTWVGFHTFRHTCATLKLREEGWSLEQVQVFLGHATYHTTARFYSHLTSKDAPVPAPIRKPPATRLAERRAS